MYFLTLWFLEGRAMYRDSEETKICKKCGRLLPLSEFRLMRGQFYNPYYLGHCKECEYKNQKDYLTMKNEVTFSDNLQYIIDIQYKTIRKERMLNLSKLDIIPIGTDEMFVQLMDYKNVWISNYGRAITKSNGKYTLIKGSYDSKGKLRYTFNRNRYINGKYIYKI